MRLLALSVIALAGCTSIPAAYRGPTRTYESPAIEQLAVHGFRRTDYREGAAFSSIAAAQLGLPGTSSGTGITNDGAMFRYFLEDTRCFRVVDDQNTGSLRIEGSAEGQHGIGGLGFTVGMLESILPYFPQVATVKVWAFREGPRRAGIARAFS